MCVSCVVQVVAVEDEVTVTALGAAGTPLAVSLLAFDGPRPQPGQWLLCHSGFALEALEADEARRVLAAQRTASYEVER